MVLCPCLLVCVSCLFGCVFLFGLVFVAVCFQGKFCLIRFQSSSIPVVDRQCLVLVRQCRKKKSNLSTSNSVSERVVVLRFLLGLSNLNYVSCDASDNLHRTNVPNDRFAEKNTSKHTIIENLRKRRAKREPKLVFVFTALLAVFQG